MSILGKKSPTIQIDPSMSYKCIESHVSKYGVFREGTVERGSSPAVAAAARYWAPDDATDSEAHALRRERDIYPHPRL